MAEAHAFIGIAKVFNGRSEEAETHVSEALRLSPRDHRANLWMHFVGSAKLHLGKDEEAVSWLKRSLEADRNHPLSQFYYGAALALLGRLEGARSAVQVGLAFNPTFTISRFRVGTPSDNATYLAQRERVYDGMHMAGVPEG